MNSISRPTSGHIFGIAISLVLICGAAQAAPSVVERNLGKIDNIVTGMLGEQDIAIAFSPDNQHTAYWAAAPDHSYVYAVRDGVPGKHYDEVSENRRGEIITDDLVFSPDSKHLAYRAHRGQKWLAVVDGKEGKLYDYIWPADDLHFSADSSRLAYRASKGKTDSIVIESALTARAIHVSKAPPVQEPTYPDVPSSPTAPKVDTAQQGKQWICTVNGKQLGAAYDYVAATALSPDFLHVAYQAKKGDKWCVVVDGVEGPWYDGLYVGDPPLYSPDSKRLAYVVRQGTGTAVQSFAVVDGKLSRAYDGIFNLAFSPDSLHLVFWGERDKVRFINADGTELGPYTLYGGPARSFEFRPSGCTTMAMRGNEAFQLKVLFDDTTH